MIEIHSQDSEENKDRPLTLNSKDDPSSNGKDATKDVIPDEVPRKDGPGGEC